jgi:hypothetical protein
MENKIRRSGGKWLADFTDPATGKRRRVTAATQQQAQERMKFELAAVGDAAPRTAAFSMREAMALTHQMRWAGKASETNAMGYCSQVVDFYGPAYPIAKVDAQSCMKMRLSSARRATATRRSTGSTAACHRCSSARS